MRAKITSLSAVLCLLIFFSACRKKKGDTTSPLVSISSPGSGQIFSMFDTVVVSAHVSDETKLTSVVVSLNDGNNLVVQNSISVGIQGKDFTFTLKYPLTQYHLPSGFYYISIMANDGSNSHQSSQKIYINESPTVKTGYFIVGASQLRNIVNYNTSMVQQGVITLNTGYNGMAYGGYNKQLFINGNINQAFQSYNTTTGVPDWTQAYGGGGVPQCINVFTDGKKPYVSYYTGSITCYNNSGTPDRTFTNTNTSYYATYFAQGSTYNAGLFKDKFGGTDKMICWTKNGGAAVNSNFVPCQVVGIFEHTSDEFYVLGNNGSNNALVYFYSVSANTFAGPISLQPGKVLDAVEIDSDFLVYASANGNIYGYRYSTGNTVTLASAVAQKLFYHPKMNELTASCKNNLNVYAVSGNYSLTLQNSYALADSIVGFEVITNK